MKEKNPLEDFLAKIGDLLLQIQDHKDPISQNLTPEVFLQLDKLEKFMQSFEELNQKVFQASQININRLRIDALKSNQTKGRDKSIIERAAQLENDAKRLQTTYSMLANQAKAQKKKNPQKQRKNKFKQIGGNKGWIPL